MPWQARTPGPLPDTDPCPRGTTPPDPADIPRIRALATMPPDDLGVSEEDVKIHFVVPFLEALGHTRMRFEHARTDIVLTDGLPRGSHVVVETKRPDANLDAHLARLHMYAIAERSLLAVLTNGGQFRIYTPFWNNAPSFAETLLWEFERADLAREDNVIALVSVLSRSALATGWAKAALLHRQAAIEGTWAAAEKIRQQFHQQRKQIEDRLHEIERLHVELDAERKRLVEDSHHLAPRERDKLRRLFRGRSVPIIPTSDFGFLVSPRADVPPRAGRAPRKPCHSELVEEPFRGATPDRKRTPSGRRATPVPPQTLRRWTLLDLHARATPKQKRLFAAFVRLGRRTAAAAELAHRAGLSVTTIPSVLAKYIGGAAKLGREPLMQQVEKAATKRGRGAGEGRTYAILPRYRPLIRRLYAKTAR